MLKHLFTLLLLLTGAVVSACPMHVTACLILQMDGTPSRSVIFRSIEHILPMEAAHAAVSADSVALTVELSGNVAGEKIRVGKGDGPYSMFGGDTAEVFLRPNLETGIYYHFALDSAGRIYMAKNGDAKWKPPVPVELKAEKLTDRCWKAVFRIPYAALSAPVPVQTPKEYPVRWGANFVFGKSWAQTSDYHNPDQFGSLIFHPQGQGKPLQQPWLKSMTLEDGGKNLVCRFSHGEEDRTPCGTRGHKNIAFYNYCLEVFLAPGMNFNDAVKLDKFYYTAGDTVQITGNNTDFTLCNGYGKITKISGKEIKNLPVGCYSLTDEAANCTVSFIVQEKYPEIPQPKGRLGILNNRALTADGKPFYPIMLSDAATAKPFLHITGGVSCGFAREPVTGYLFSHDTDGQVKQLADYVNRAEKQPLPVLHRILYESQLPLIIKDKDGKTSVEPDQAKFYKEIYQKFKAAYPDRIFSIHADGDYQIRGRAEACDVIEYASWGSGYAPAIIPFLNKDITKLQRAVPDKPILLWLGGSIAGNSQRTAEELRCAIFLSLLNDCAGNVIHLGHGGIPKERKAIWSLMNGIQQEINRIYPDFVLGKNLTASYTQSEQKTGNTMVHAEIREREDGSCFMVLVNESHLPARFKKWYLAPYDARIIELSQDDLILMYTENMQ